MRLLTKILCEWLGWHQELDAFIVQISSTQGRQPHLDYWKAYCARCGCPLLKDSQGNWFKGGGDFRWEGRRND